MKTLAHTHDRERFPEGNGYRMQEHLHREHPVLAQRLIDGDDGGAGLWPTASYVDEAHLLEHRMPLWDGSDSGRAGEGE